MKITITNLSSFEQLADSFDRAVGYLDNLQAAELQFRTAYVGGPGSMPISRAWLEVKLSGNRARAFLASLKRPDEERSRDTDAPYGKTEA